MVAADAGFYSADNRRQAQEKGVEKLAVPNKRTRSRARVGNINASAGSSEPNAGAWDVKDASAC